MTFAEAPGVFESAKLAASMLRTTTVLRSSAAMLRTKIAMLAMLDWASLTSPFVELLDLVYGAPEVTRDAVLSGLRTLDNVISLRLDSTKQAVLRGELAPERWLAAAQEIATGIESQAAVLNEYSTSSLLQATFRDLKEDIRQFRAAMPGIPSAGLPWWAYAAGGVVSLGVLGYFLSSASYFIPRRTLRR